jgi:cytoplasmic iron level regulating protein YaaA (DUF328/UPF0246 family)
MKILISPAKSLDFENNIETSLVLHPYLLIRLCRLIIL